MDLNKVWHKFNKKYFNGKLLTLPKLKMKASEDEILIPGLLSFWTAGCFQAKRNGRGGTSLSIIVNSNQSKKGILETVLHEMIHQWLWQEGGDSGHGLEFQKIHRRIFKRPYMLDHGD
jgi:hypothetical protein